MFIFMKRCAMMGQMSVDTMDMCEFMPYMSERIMQSFYFSFISFIQLVQNTLKRIKNQGVLMIHEPN